MLNQRDVDPVLNVMLAQNLYIYIKKKKKLPDISFTN